MADQRLPVSLVRHFCQAIPDTVVGLDPVVLPLEIPESTRKTRNSPQLTMIS